MDFVAVDGLEAALAEVLLGRGGEQIELAQSARRETVKQLTNDPPAEPGCAGTARTATERISAAN